MNVLINKANIKNQKELDDFETTMFNLAAISIQKANMGVVEIKDIFKIHKLLFGEVYEWAGQIRTINMEKSEYVLDGLSVSYSKHTNILKEINKINKEYNQINWNELSKKEKISELTIIISSLWQAHPFREGNTRTVAMLLFFIMQRMGLKINQDFIKNNAKFLETL
jgi:cell filamentation protein